MTSKFDDTNGADGSEKHSTDVHRQPEHEFVLTRSLKSPSHLVFEAWSKPELFQQWWVPKSCGLKIVSCKMDVRTGGNYRLVLAHPACDQPMAFFGSYTDVLPNERLVWTNEESADGAITAVVLNETDGCTMLAITNAFGSAKALDDEVASGAIEALEETLMQLEAFLGGHTKG